MDKFWQKTILVKPYNTELKKNLKGQSNQYNDTKNIEKL
jgi:hypothetical protein